ncbi:hypothetical protein [Thalassospira lucentensis]|uniref:hypothetical protein n=1 Tax=Thalassospira lucentensis TaxID=168935 RepID=UPI00142D624A|nr:hypothetical protein [Thalassospira lucentensis]NIZ03540.1 hypothetical protein [Thalassospira lucentensis]
MANDFKLQFGKTYVPKKQDIIISDDLISGNGWRVLKLGKKYIFEFLAARHGGGVDQYELSSEEFENVRIGKLSFDELMDLTDRNPRRHPFKTT